MFSKKQMAKKGSLVGVFAAVGAYVAGFLPDVPGVQEAVTGVLVGLATAGQNWLKQKAKQ